MKKAKKLLVVVLALAMIFSTLPMAVFETSAAETSGTTGSCTWNYDAETKTLTVSGEGATLRSVGC